ncbi:peroxide-responsive transcriptional repressor PerR [Thermoactinomyces mirandus]|uniref:Peroxide-responsive transcriptional repressor PerR n=1 Tax=Thermoactinomyces mirandus TaxID=2756294 RepID=A0A7W2AQA9_9BACL|nr:peroxide-responsive transcriptional repressor PerR [Thermoactinomyces mirandus]MBA4601117.1 peroxide-responsive transcriptional repressor PerR [Thermoactinomyces mirandus]
MSNKLLEMAVETLKENGVRMTPQRHAILGYLYSVTSHPTADEIYKALEGTFPNMSVATVYNNLRVFKDVGLVREMTYGDASSRFDANMIEHYHIICNSCGKIIDFDHRPLNEIEEKAETITGFKVQSHRLELYGICPDCQIRSNQ